MLSKNNALWRFLVTTNQVVGGSNPSGRAITERLGILLGLLRLNACQPDLNFRRVCARLMQAILGFHLTGVR